MDAIRVLTDDLELAGGEDAVLVIDDLHHVDDGELTWSTLAPSSSTSPTGCTFSS